MQKSNSSSASPGNQSTLKLFCPAKLNLFLAITGRREDGFHELISVVAPISLGDDLVVTRLAAGDADKLQIAGRPIPGDGPNLILKAAAAWREASGTSTGFAFELTKRVPPGGGFGGGSSNAASALQAMNELSGSPLSAAELYALAAKIGSDCPLFLHPGPVCVRGRGEKVEPWPQASGVLADWHLLLIDPGFSVNTAEAYSWIAANPHLYCPLESAQHSLAKGWACFCQGEPQALLFNNLGAVISQRFPIYEALRDLSGVADNDPVGFAITGSGSGCFFLSREASLLKRIQQRLAPELAGHGFVIESRFFCPHPAH